MRVRLLGIVLSLVALLVVGLGVPLALSVAQREQQFLFLDRLTDTSRYASLAQRPLLDQEAEALRDELISFRTTFDIDAVVFDRDRQPVASSNALGQGEPFQADQVTQELNNALGGKHPESASLLLPWNTDLLVIAEPVLVDGEVQGAVITRSPTGAARGRVVFWWSVILIGGILALGLAVLVALPLVGWTLRPVRRLDQATGSLVAAVMSGRPVPPVDDGHGPAELRHLSKSFDQMAASVSDTLAAQRAFVADASHQLRNPLTALRLRLSNLEGHVDEEEAEHHVAAMAETDRLNQIVDDLLAMARAEGMGGELVAVDVVATVSTRMTDWEAVADSRDVSLELSASADEVFATAAPRSVEAMLDALLDNALKFTAEGSSVTVGIAEDDTNVYISVRDHGPGLQPEELERATDRFWRSPAHQNIGGSGLGLAITRRLVERAGGEIGLDLPDDGDGGLRVTIQLPRA
ncbi:HAMP domain-containing histidine kinase [Kibdelosporangium philippinense]|uniref:histidine kinase n=1 Tax=Kibdelosporangium philippinense TaxID=211113 RepID=A0ABS8ZP36_9PSEU|nr:HAMP domain-containing sensor histidine kinase [Kibdelosporangium philippinense]MCE7009516.1 HAMP domain-containing histidine kinase [Kibdelosporangium philippinense]